MPTTFASEEARHNFLLECASASFRTVEYSVDNGTTFFRPFETPSSFPFVRTLPKNYTVSPSLQLNDTCDYGPLQEFVSVSSLEFPSTLNVCAPSFPLQCFACLFVFTHICASYAS